MQPTTDKSGLLLLPIDSGFYGNLGHLTARAAVAHVDSRKGLLAIARDHKQDILGLAALLAEIDEWDDCPTDDVIVEAILLFRDITNAAGSASAALNLMRKPIAQDPTFPCA